MHNEEEMIKICLDYDDFSDQSPENCLDQIEIMIKEIPNIKINLFTIPALRALPIRDDKWISRVKELIDSQNLFLSIHGLIHSHLEFQNVTETHAERSIKHACKILAERGLDYLPVFKGPNWGINADTYFALNKLGFTHVFNHHDHKWVEDLAACSEISTVYYNWNLKDDPPKEETLIVHGHTHNVCGNGIKETWPKLLEWYHSQEKVVWLAANEL